MILPHTYFAVLLLMIVSAFCWGSWTGALKMARGWRFELFAFDMAFGLMAVCLIYALVFGNMGYDGFSLVDDIMHAGKRQWAFGLVGGLVFALSNLFMLAAVSIGGMAVGLTIAFGTAAIVQAGVNYFGTYTGNPLLPIGGAVLTAAAIIAASLIHSSLVIQRHEEIAKAGRAKSTRRPSSMKPILLAILSGLLMQAWKPLLQMGTTGEIGLGPYAASIFLGAGALFGVLAFGIFFIFLPVEGEPLEMSSIIASTPGQHLKGWLGGAILATAVVARLVAVAANADPGGGGGLPAEAKPVSASLGCLLGYSGAFVAVLLGFMVWKELKDDAHGPAHWMGVAMPVLFLCGIALISLSAAAPIVP